MKPFFEETYEWWDIEMYNPLDIAELGDRAPIKKFTSKVLPELKQVALKAKEFGYESFCIIHTTEKQHDFNVDDFGDLDV